ncbi:hypothetical protein T484DRAFT_1886907, partial [Baffinella frigidus]
MSRPGVGSSAGEGDAPSAPDAQGSGAAAGQDEGDEEFEEFLREVEGLTVSDQAEAPSSAAPSAAAREKATVSALPDQPPRAAPAGHWPHQAEEVVQPDTRWAQERKERAQQRKTAVSHAKDAQATWQQFSVQQQHPSPEPKPAKPALGAAKPAVGAGVFGTKISFNMNAKPAKPAPRTKIAAPSPPPHSTPPDNPAPHPSLAEGSDPAGAGREKGVSRREVGGSNGDGGAQGGAAAADSTGTRGGEAV